MRVVIAGGHGQVALLLEARLAGRGDEAVGIVRNPSHADDLADAGATAVVADLETSRLDDVAEIVAGADAVVFAAGAGPGSGAPRKLTVDRDAAILLADAAVTAGVHRYLMVSAMSVDDADPDSDDVFQVYLRAKAAADADLRRRDLDWTIVRPGRLTNDPGTGRVRLAERVPYGEIPRADVAAVLAGALIEPATIRRQFDVVSGDTPVETALRQ